MNKEAITTKIQEDLEDNRKIWGKNIKIRNIFIILTICNSLPIIFTILSIFVSFFPGRSVNIGFFLAAITLLICFSLSVIHADKSDECRIKEGYLKKALWITKYWLTPTLELDKSFLKHNYPTEENRSAVDHVLDHIDMEIKEKK